MELLELESPQLGKHIINLEKAISCAISHNQYGVLNATKQQFESSALGLLNTLPHSNTKNITAETTLHIINQYITDYVHKKKDGAKSLTLAIIQIIKSNHTELSKLEDKLEILKEARAFLEETSIKRKDKEFRINKLSSDGSIFKEAVSECISNYGTDFNYFVNIAHGEKYDASRRWVDNSDNIICPQHEFLKEFDVICCLFEPKIETLNLIERISPNNNVLIASNSIQDYIKHEMEKRNERRRNKIRFLKLDELSLLDFSMFCNSKILYRDLSESNFKREDLGKGRNFRRKESIYELEPESWNDMALIKYIAELKNFSDNRKRINRIDGRALTLEIEYNFYWSRENLRHLYEDKLAKIQMEMRHNLTLPSLLALYKFFCNRKKGGFLEEVFIDSYYSLLKNKTKCSTHDIYEMISKEEDFFTGIDLKTEKVIGFKENSACDSVEKTLNILEEAHSFSSFWLRKNFIIKL